MLAVNLVLHVHFPQETADFRLRSVGRNMPWMDTGLNNLRFREWSRELFWPLARTLAKAMRRYPQSLRLNLSLSRSFLELCQSQDPVQLEFWQDLVGLTGCELLAEPSFHGLAAMMTENELEAQLSDHSCLLSRMFGKSPSIMHNPGLIYSDFVGRVAHRLGFRACLMEGSDPILPADTTASHTFHHSDIPSLRLMPSHPGFTSDLQQLLARRESRPLVLTAERFQSWFLKEARRGGEVVTLFLDLSQAIARAKAFQSFLESWLALAAEDPGCRFVNASQCLSLFPSRGPVHVATPTSQSLEGHDVSAWLGNSLQQDVLEKLNGFADRVMASQDPDIVRDWRRLQALDLFAQMRVIFFESEEDEPLHTKTNPYDVYLRIMNMLEDLEFRLKAREMGADASTLESPAPHAFPAPHAHRASH